MVKYGEIATALDVDTVSRLEQIGGQEPADTEVPSEKLFVVWLYAEKYRTKEDNSATV